MKNPGLKLLDTVVLKDSSFNIVKPGAVGKIVEILGSNDAFEVEFLDEEGYTVAVLILTADQFSKVPEDVDPKFWSAYVKSTIQYEDVYRRLADS